MTAKKITEKTAEMVLIRVGHHVWAQHKRSRGKTPQTGLESAFYAQAGITNRSWERGVWRRCERKRAVCPGFRLLIYQMGDGKPLNALEL